MVPGKHNVELGKLALDIQFQRTVGLLDVRSANCQPDTGATSPFLGRKKWLKNLPRNFGRYLLAVVNHDRTDTFAVVLRFNPDPRVFNSIHCFNGVADGRAIARPSARLLFRSRRYLWTVVRRQSLWRYCAAQALGRR